MPSNEGSLCCICLSRSLGGWMILSSNVLRDNPFNTVVCPRLLRTLRLKLQGRLRRKDPETTQQQSSPSCTSFYPYRNRQEASRGAMAESDFLPSLIGIYDNLHEPTPGWNRPGIANSLVITFLVVTWACVLFRMYTRFRIIYSPGWDDLFVSLLLVSSLQPSFRDGY